MTEELAHAILGASSASRWINCAGSVREIAKLPKIDRNKTSTYADEGSCAHNLCEHCLETNTDAKEYIGQSLAGELDVYPVTQEMVDAVQMYLDEIRGQIKRLDTGGSATVMVERRVFPIEGDPALFGTADAIVADEMIHSELVVTDFKYGAGVVVDVDYNDQAAYYALGALRLFPEIETIKLVIVQPRAMHRDGPIRRVTLERGHLLEFGGTLVGAAERTNDPDAPLRAGDWCKFCPVKGRCPELDKKALTTVKSDFSDLLDSGLEVAEDGMPANLPEPSDVVVLPDPDDMEALSKAYLLIPFLDHYTKGVQEMVRRRVEFGYEFPWAKMVRKRSNRAYKNPETIEATAVKEARKQKVPKADIFTDPKLLSVAQIEKVLGKDFTKEHAEKPEGALTIAPMNDKRAQVHIPLPIDEFGDVPELNDGKAPSSE
jgi:hypothetical protein